MNAGLQAILDTIGPFVKGTKLKASDLQAMLRGLRIALNITGPYVNANRDGIHIRAQPISAPNDFMVKVWRDGGSTDGNATNQCNRTYTVRTIQATSISTGGELLGTGMTPTKARPEKGRLICPSNVGPGTYGKGFYDENGAFKLFDATEVLNAKPCP